MRGGGGGGIFHEDKIIERESEIAHTLLFFIHHSNNVRQGRSFPEHLKGLGGNKKDGRPPPHISPLTAADLTSCLTTVWIRLYILPSRMPYRTHPCPRGGTSCSGSGDTSTDDPARCHSGRHSCTRTYDSGRHLLISSQ